MRQIAVIATVLALNAAPPVMALAQDASPEDSFEKLAQSLNEPDRQWAAAVSQTLKTYGANSDEYSCNETGQLLASGISGEISSIFYVTFILTPINSANIPTLSRVRYNLIVQKAFSIISYDKDQLGRIQAMCQSNTYVQSMSIKYTDAAAVALRWLPALKAKYGAAD